MSCIYGKKIKLLLKKVKILEESGGQGEGQNYVTVQATSLTTAATDVLPASGQAADTIYRVSNWDGSANNGAGGFDVTKYSEYTWDDVSNPNKYVFLCVNTTIGEVFDISVYNNNAKYADLTAALGTNGVNVPAEIRRGGMSVKFIQSSDNKYVSYRLTKDTWTLYPYYWEEITKFSNANVIANNFLTKTRICSDIFALGNIGVDGALQPDSNRVIVSDYIPAQSGNYKLVVPTGIGDSTYEYYFCCALYNKNKEFISRGSFTRETTYTINESNCYYIRMLIRKNLANGGATQAWNTEKELDALSPFYFYLPVIEDINGKLTDLDSTPTPASTKQINSGGVENGLVPEKAITNIIVPNENRGAFKVGRIANNAEVGSTISLDVDVNAAWVCSVLDCVEGDVITFLGRGGTDSDYLLWVFIDANNRVVSKSQVDEVNHLTTVECPANAVKFVFNNNVNYKPTYYCYKGFSAIDELVKNNDILRENIGFRIEHFTNGVLNTSGEKTNSSTNYDLSDYTSVKEGDVVFYKGMTASNSYPAICGYDSNKTFVSVLKGGTNGITVQEIITIPSSISYIRISSGSSVNPLYQGSYWQICTSYFDLINALRNIELLDNDVYNKTEILPANDRLTSDLEVVNEKVGDWAIRYNTGYNSISKNQDGTFRVSLDVSGGSNPAFWLLNVIPSSVDGKRVVISFTAKLVSGSHQSFYLTALKSDRRQVVLNSEQKEYNIEYPSYDSTGYPDKRIMLYIDDGTIVFDISNISFKTIEYPSQSIPKIQSELDSIVVAGTPDIDVPIRNMLYKLACIERGENKQAVFAFLGDSMDQHSWSTAPNHGEEGIYNLHTNYVQPFKKYLQEKYGNAGAGFYSFSISSLNPVVSAGNTKMMSADYDDAWDERSSITSGLITYRDEDAGCMGIDDADATFHEGATLTLHATTPQSKFIIHFFGSAGAGVFTYQLDSETAIEVDASQYDGYSTITINTTDATHNLAFSVTSGSVVLFGVDMQRNVAGVRVHKFGNKGATSTDFVNGNATTFKAAVQAFGLDTMTIKLGSNDTAQGIPPTTVRDNLITIAGRVREVEPFIDLQIIQQPNSVEYSNEYQAPYSRDAAKASNAGYINLIPLFGSSAQALAKGLFVSDGIHPTLGAGYMIYEHLIKRLKLFKL